MSNLNIEREKEIQLLQTYLEKQEMYGYYKIKREREERERDQNMREYIAKISRKKEIIFHLNCFITEMFSYYKLKRGRGRVRCKYVKKKDNNSPLLIIVCFRKKTTF